MGQEGRSDKGFKGKKKKEEENSAGIELFADTEEDYKHSRREGKSTLE